LLPGGMKKGGEQDTKIGTRRSSVLNQRAGQRNGKKESSSPRPKRVAGKVRVARGKNK